MDLLQESVLICLICVLFFSHKGPNHLQPNTGTGTAVRIHQVIWIQKFVEKIQVKHSVTIEEVEEVLYGKIRVRRIAKGDVEGEDVYLALGQAYSGRYLAVFFILKQNRAALPISARDMDDKERRQYGRK